MNSASFPHSVSQILRLFAQNGGELHDYRWGYSMHATGSNYVCPHFSCAIRLNAGCRHRLNRTTLGCSIFVEMSRLRHYPGRVSRNLPPPLSRSAANEANLVSSLKSGQNRPQVDKMGTVGTSDDSCIVAGRFDTDSTWSLRSRLSSLPLSLPVFTTSCPSGLY